MHARISSIRLIRNDKGVYWEITLVDMNGNVIGKFGDENHCSDIDFRNQTFYLMSILHNFDLLLLDGQPKSFPIFVDNEFYRINRISNSDGDYMEFDYKTGEIILGSGCDISDFCMENITSLESSSGVMMATVRDKYSRRSVMADLAYLGYFTSFLDLRVTDEKKREGARNFKDFVCGILDLCGIDELIQSDNYPQVLIELGSDLDQVVSIGDVEGKDYLHITDEGYELSTVKSKLYR